MLPEWHRLGLHSSTRAHSTRNWICSHCSAKDYQRNGLDSSRRSRRLCRGNHRGGIRRNQQSLSEISCLILNLVPSGCSCIRTYQNIESNAMILCLEISWRLLQLFEVLPPQYPTYAYSLLLLFVVLIEDHRERYDNRTGSIDFYFSQTSMNTP